MKNRKSTYSNKIHCFNCGTMRTGRLAFIMEVASEEDSSKIEGKVIYLHIKNFHKIAQTTTHVELPTALFGECSVCNTQTFYALNANRKLEIVDL
jgi:hypothetical protein